MSLLEDLRQFFKGFEKRDRILSWRIFLNGYPVPRHIYGALLKYKRGDEIKIGDWSFSIPYGLLYLDESHNWFRDYIPPTGIKGKRILDVGAGDGETSKFFLDNGADLVFAVENNQDCILRLLKNQEKNKRLIVLPGDFKPETHLSLNVDLVKIDIEGYEIDFANWLEKNPGYNKDTMIEVHSAYLVNRFRALGFADVSPELSPPYGYPPRSMYRWSRLN